MIYIKNVKTINNKSVNTKVFVFKISFLKSAAFHV